MITPEEWIFPSESENRNSVTVRFWPVHQEVDVRDQIDTGGYFTVSREDWEIFLTAVKAGEFDLPPVP